MWGRGHTTTRGLAACGHQSGVDGGLASSWPRRRFQTVKSFPIFILQREGVIMVKRRDKVYPGRHDRRFKQRNKTALGFRRSLPLVVRSLHDLVRLRHQSEQHHVDMPSPGTYVNAIYTPPVTVVSAFLDEDLENIVNPDSDLDPHFWMHRDNARGSFQLLEFILNACGPVIRLPYPRGSHL